MAGISNQKQLEMYLSGHLRYQHLAHKQADPLPDWLRFIVLAMSYQKRHFRCYYCGWPLKTGLETGIREHQKARDYHCDHRIPRKKGGSNEVHNLEASCKDCNMIKSDHITFDVRLAAWRLGENVGYASFRQMFQAFLYDENERYNYLQEAQRQDEYYPDELIPYRHHRKGERLIFPGLRTDCTFDTAIVLRWEQQIKTENFFTYLEYLESIEIREYALECYQSSWGINATDFIEETK